MIAGAVRTMAASARRVALHCPPEIASGFVRPDIAGVPMSGWWRPMSDRDHRPAGPPGRTRDGRGAAPAGSTPLEQYFDAGSLYALRAAVAAHAAAADLSTRQVYDVVVAAHELAANSVVHGPGHGWLRLWAADGFLYCQVSDDGRADPAGTRNPAEARAPWRTEHGHGLWVVSQVADKIRIDRGRAGTTVIVGFAVTPPP